jgi:hypothetical protein
LFLITTIKARDFFPGLLLCHGRDRIAAPSRLRIVANIAAGEQDGFAGKCRNRIEQNHAKSSDRG